MTARGIGITMTTTTIGQGDGMTTLTTGTGTGTAIVDDEMTIENSIGMYRGSRRIPCGNGCCDRTPKRNARESTCGSILE
jgi:hypothetical protein